MKFSNKDLILLFGILVAMIVALTTVVFTERSTNPQTTENAVTPNASVITPSGLVKKAIDKIEFKSLIR